VGTSKLQRSQNILLQILATFEINNLATGFRARGWDIVTSLVKLSQGCPRQVKGKGCSIG